MHKKKSKYKLPLTCPVCREGRLTRKNSLIRRLLSLTSPDDCADEVERLCESMSEFLTAISNSNRPRRCAYCGADRMRGYAREKSSFSVGRCPECRQLRAEPTLDRAEQVQRRRKRRK